jgi:3-deoxy-D-manno-octulosonic-acid transferase
MTATGRREGARLFNIAIDSGQLRQAWLPYDTPGACKRFLNKIVPSCGILIEREVWPNLIHEANLRGIPMVLASARLSERSAKRGQLAGRVLRDAYAGLDRVLAQTEQDATRLRTCGARHVKICGNIKFDVVAPADQITLGRTWRKIWNRPVIIIASTQEGEETAFIHALVTREWPHGNQDTPLLVIVPRHPERFDSVAAQLAEAGLRWIRRTAIDLQHPLPEGVQVLLGDSMGELPAYYAAGDVAIVAGGFIATGGQNLIEPCAVGTPVVVGPHARNFAQVTQEALSVGAVLRATDPADALDIALKLMDNAPTRANMVAAGLRYVASHVGAGKRVLDNVAQLLAARGLVPGQINTATQR